MSAHTPGPWKVVDGGRFGFDVFITTESRINSHHGEICSMEIEFTGPHGVEQRANARLIALAPEMLAALEEINNVALGQPYAGCTCGEIARAILAKVKGEVS